MNSFCLAVFDSGIGGLTVAREIVRRMPNEEIVYLGDTARLPYGTKSAMTVIKYAVKNATFLSKFSPKALVVACNTVSSVALPALRELLDIPVVGVIRPGAQHAVKVTKTGRIGVIGQPGTIRSGRYEAEIRTLLPKAVVFSRAAPLLVPLAEEGWVGSEVASLVLKEYLAPIISQKIDTLVLGCTHYPVFTDQIADLLTHGFGTQVSLVDSATSLAAALEEMLEQQKLRNHKEKIPTHRFFVTDNSESVVKVGKRFWGNGFQNVVEVDI